MKRVIIPRLEALDHASIEYAGNLLENEGKREALDTLNWPREFPYHPITTFNIGYSPTAIYIKYDVHGSMLRAIYTNDQEPVYEDSCVGFFCQRPGSDHYLSLGFNCIGTCLAARRKGREEDVQRLTASELRSIGRYSSLGRRAFMEMEGMFAWDLVVRVPFALLGYAGGEVPERLLGNFYKCADGTESRHFLTWAPVKTEKPDFHRPEFFGELVFAR